MTTHEERIAFLEKTTIPRIDFINGINRLSLQLAQTASDLSHELTILLGVVGSQEQDIKILKGDVSTLQADVSILREDVNTLKQDVSILKKDVNNIKGRLDRLEDRFDRLETKSDNQTTLLTQILARLPEKP